MQSRLVLSPFVSPTAEEVKIRGHLLAYRGTALTLGLLALSVSIPPWRTSLGLELIVASWSTLILAVLALGVLTMGQARSALQRANLSSPPTTPASTQDVDLSDPERANELQLRAYQDLALNQARSSYQQSQAAMAVALGILALGGISVASWTEGKGQVIIGLLTGLGTTFSAFLGRTFLKERQRSVEQLNRSYALPLTKNLLLFSQRVAEGVTSPSNRDKLLIDVVAGAMRAVELTMPGAGSGPITAPGSDGANRRIRKTRRRAPTVDGEVADG